MQTISPEDVVTMRNHGIEVLIPQAASKALYVEILNRLLQLSEEKREATWIIDVSEHQGISLGLGGMLMNLIKMARGRGCAIRITGIQNVTSVFSPLDSEWISRFDMKVISRAGGYEVTLLPF